MATFKVGDRFGMWVVERDCYAARHQHVPCRCDCGTERGVSAANLSCGNSKSCGCVSRVKSVERGLRIKAERAANPRPRTPPKPRPPKPKNVNMNRPRVCEHPLYSIWQGIRERCHGLTINKDYQGRGITVFDGWRDPSGFSAFITYIQTTLGKRPSYQHTLDRINVDGHYEPGNLRWATRLEQANNRRDNVLLEVDGVVMPVAQAAQKLGISYSAAWNRANKQVVSTFREIRWLQKEVRYCESELGSESYLSTLSDSEYRALKQANLDGARERLGLKMCQHFGLPLKCATELQVLVAV